MRILHIGTQKQPIFQISEHTMVTKTPQRWSQGQAVKMSLLFFFISLSFSYHIFFCQSVANHLSFIIKGSEISSRKSEKSLLQKLFQIQVIKNNPRKFNQKSIKMHQKTMQTYLIWLLELKLSFIKLHKASESSLKRINSHAKTRSFHRIA